MAVLKSLPPSSDPTRTAVLVDRKQDPELVRLEEMVAPLDLKGSNGRAQAPKNWPAMSAKHVATRISELVHFHVAGENASEEEYSLQAVGGSILELKSRLNSEVLPLGLIRLNVSSFKALLFKVRLTAESYLSASCAASSLPLVRSQAS